jgi:hypothetical protein
MPSFDYVGPEVEVSLAHDRDTGADRPRLTRASMLRRSVRFSLRIIELLWSLLLFSAREARFNASPSRYMTALSQRIACAANGTVSE